MNYRELFIKLYDDKCFKNFCNTIDEMRNKEYKIEIPLETLALWVSSGVDYIKGENNIEVIHNCVKHFLNPSVSLQVTRQYVPKVLETKAYSVIIV